MNNMSASENQADDSLDVSKEKYYMASQWQLMWWRFRKHRLAILGSIVLALLYLIVIFAPFLSPYATNTRFAAYQYAPPQRVRFYDPNDGFSLRPFVYGLKGTRDMETFRQTFEEDPSEKHYINFFVRGTEYKLLGLFETDLHLFGTEDHPIFLFGSDRSGRDLFTRVLYGAQISLTIGLVGVFLSFVLGTILGSISGFYGGVLDTIIQRVIDMLISIPTIPLWMALSAALPRDWPITQMYFAIVVVLSLVGWTGLARVVRGKFLSLREEGFVMAAQYAGASDIWVITKHLLPSFLSYIVVSITLSIPQMILGETALSFLGLGLQAPAVSWGVLLQDAQNIRTVAHHPWLLIPAAWIIVTVLMFNFLGDGLRDAADPYST